MLQDSRNGLGVAREKKKWVSCFGTSATVTSAPAYSFIHGLESPTERI